MKFRSGKLTAFTTAAIGLTAGMAVATGIALPQTAQAQTLLVIANSLGEWGQSSQTFERFAADLIGDSIAQSGEYRKVYRFVALDAVDRNQSFTDYWKQILAEREAGEKIDIFEQDHTTGSFLGITDPVSFSDATPAIPPGFIRRFYSSGCSNWGTFTAAPDGSDIQASPFQPYLQGLKSAAVEEYVIHANTNSESLFLLPLLLSEMRTGESWLTAGLRASNGFDGLVGGEAAKILSSMDTLAVAMNSLFSDSSVSGEIDSSELLVSRLVLGGTAMPAFAPQVQGQTMWNSSDESMLAPTGKLLAFQKSTCPKVYGDFGDTTCNALDRPTTVDSIQETVSVFQRLFGLLEDSEGCVDPTPFSHFLEGLKDKRGNSPSFEKVCFTREGDQTFVVSWKLTPTTSGAILERLLPDAYVEGQDIWQIQFGSKLAMDGTSIEGVSLERDGQIRFHFTNGLAQAEITGLGLNGISAPGLDGVPRFLRNVGVTGLELDNQMNVRLGGSAALFAFPLNLTLDADGSQEFKIGPILIQ